MTEEMNSIKEENKAAEAEKTEQKPDKKKCKADKKLENEIAALKAELEQKETEAKEQNDKYLRVVAEYDNFRRRSKAERDGVYTDAYSDAVSEILPILDNLERAAAFDDGEKIVEGLKLTLKCFNDTLQKMGVCEIETKTFDPAFHNAVMHVEDDSFGEGEIVEVFQKGYKKGDKIIRYAVVKTAN